MIKKKLVVKHGPLQNVYFLCQSETRDGYHCKIAPYW